MQLCKCWTRLYLANGLIVTGHWLFWINYFNFWIQGQPQTQSKLYSNLIQVDNQVQWPDIDNSRQSASIKFLISPIRCNNVNLWYNWLNWNRCKWKFCSLLYLCSSYTYHTMHQFPTSINNKGYGYKINIEVKTQTLPDPEIWETVILLGLLYKLTTNYCFFILSLNFCSIKGLI